MKAYKSERADEARSRKALRYGLIRVAKEEKRKQKIKIGLKARKMKEELGKCF